MTIPPPKPQLRGDYPAPAGDSDNSPNTVTVTEPWGPFPVDDERESVPIEQLPEPLGRYVAALSEHLQVPPDLVLLPALSVLSGCTRGRYRVQGHWLEHSTAIYSAVFLPPGELKSPTMREVAAPLREYETALQIDRKASVRTQQERHEMLADRVQALRKRVARNGQDADLAAEYDDAVGQLAESEPAYLPQLVGQDVTPERLATLLDEQGETLTLLSAEGGLIGNLAGRYNDGWANLDLVNAAYSCEPVTVDRQGKPSVRLVNPHLAIGLAVQPDVLREMQANAPMAARGFLDRFLVAEPEPRVGTRELRTPDMPTQVQQLWSRQLQKLLQVATAHLDTQTRVTLQLTPDALAEYEPWWTAAETRQQPDGDLCDISGWVQKWRGSVMRIAGLFALLVDPHTEKVEAEHMRSALAVGDYLLSHARYVFGESALRLPSARLLAAIRQLPESVFSSRDIQRKVQNQKWLANSEKAERVELELEHLQQLGYVRRLPQEYGSKSHRWERHPYLRG